MNVLHISTASSWRGGEQQLVYLVEELQKQQINQWVMCSKDSVLETKCKISKINYIPCIKHTSFDIFWAKKLKNICVDKEIDILHLHDAHALTYAVLAGVLFNNKVKMVLSRKVDFPIKNNLFSNFKYNFKDIKKIICVSEKIREIISTTIKEKQKLITIFDGVDLTRFNTKIKKNILRSTYKISSENILIGNVAAIAPHKDYFTFVDTAERLLKLGVKASFFIIGEGPERDAIENYIAAKKLETSIILLGFREDITDLLPELDIFLMTSKTEGLGSSILDAYACKVPVVSTSAGGIPEIVENNVTGLLSPVKNSMALAENVIRILNDITLREKLILNASEKLTHFSKEKMAFDTMKVYSEI